MKFSLVIPCFNEAKNLPLLLQKCKKVLSSDDIEIIIVDNGSTDDTKEVIEKHIKNYPGFRSVHVKENEGYGNGILAGLNAAKGRILGWTHADLQTNPSDSIVGLEFFEKYGDDIFCKGKRYGRPFLDMFFTFGMSIFESIFMRKKLWDINAQPTMFSKEFFKSWDEPPQDFSLDLYAYYMARKMNLRVFRFPVLFGERAFGVSTWNVNFKSRYIFIKRTLAYSLSLFKKMSKK